MTKIKKIPHEINKKNVPKKPLEIKKMFRKNTHETARMSTQISKPPNYPKNHKSQNYPKNQKISKTNPPKSQKSPNYPKNHKL